MEMSASTGEPQAASMVTGVILNTYQTIKVKTRNRRSQKYVYTLPIPAPGHIKGFAKKKKEKNKSRGEQGGGQEGERMIRYDESVIVCTVSDRQSQGLCTVHEVFLCPELNIRKVPKQEVRRSSEEKS